MRIGCSAADMQLAFRKGEHPLRVPALSGPLCWIPHLSR